MRWTLAILWFVSLLLVPVASCENEYVTIGDDSTLTAESPVESLGLKWATPETPVLWAGEESTTSDGQEKTWARPGDYDVHGGSGDCQYSIGRTGESYWKTTSTYRAYEKGKYVYQTPVVITELVLNRALWTYSGGLIQHLLKWKWQPYESGYVTMRYRPADLKDIPTCILTGPNCSY